MVLWEVALATAYFLGLRRSYKLALKAQRRLIGPNHPGTREFLQRRTRSVFDIVVKVHQGIQQRDLQVGRNLGNWMLRWLDCMKPSAEIVAAPCGKVVSSNNNLKKHAITSVRRLAAPRPNVGTTWINSKRRLLFTSLNNRPKPMRTLAMMLLPTNSVGLNSRFRSLFSRPFYGAELGYRLGGTRDVLRKDIATWMLQN